MVEPKINSCLAFYFRQVLPQPDIMFKNTNYEYGTELFFQLCTKFLFIILIFSLNQRDFLDLFLTIQMKASNL